MARASLFRTARRTLARWLAPEFARGFDATSWKRFPPEARFGRAVQETLMSRAVADMRGAYYFGSDCYAHAGCTAAVTYGWGAGATAAHPDADRFEEWGLTCDADGLRPFDALFGAGVLEMIVRGELLFLFVQRDELKVRLIPGSQLDDSLSRELSNGGNVNAGIETDRDGIRTGYHIKPTLPQSQWETDTTPVRIDAADVVHLFRPMFVGQTRGLSWLTPAMLKLSDTGLLADALLQQSRASALLSVYLIDRDGSPADLPFQGEKSGDQIDLSLLPGGARVLRGQWDAHTVAPQQAQQGLEFMHAQINAIAASLGVCSYMVSGDCSKSSYSSLRADLLKMKAHISAWQWSVLVPALNAIWRRWALVESLRGNAVSPEMPTWRFEQFPDADPSKAIVATREALKLKIMSRREAIEARGEDPDRVTDEIQNDPLAQAEQETDEGDSNSGSEDSNANP